MKIWLFSTLFTGFMIGVVVGTLYETPFEVSVFVCAVALTIALIWRRNSEAISAPFLLTLSLGILFIGLGMFRTEIANREFGHSVLEPLVGTTVTLAGEVIKEPEERTAMQQLTIEVGEDRLLVSTDRHEDISYGDIIEFSGKLERPTSFETEYGRTFDYIGYLKAKGIEYQVSFAEVEILEEDKGNIIISYLLSAKEQLKRGIEQSIDEPASSLGLGLLLGEKRGLGDALEEDFRRTGIVHIVVLSGYNVMLVVTFVMFLLSFTIPKRFRLWFGLVAVICFALMVGLSATVVRASAMAALLLIAGSLKRTYDVMRALLLAGFVMVAINPYLLIYDVGFQLSFMATLGLILALPYIELPEKKGILSHLRGYIGATIATQISVLPLLLFHIGQVSLVSVFVNVLVLPIVSFAMLFTFITGMIAQVSLPLAMPFSFIATGFLEYIIILASWWGSLPFAAVEVPVISPYIVAFLYVLLAVAYTYLRRANSNEVKLETLSGWTIIEEQEDVKEIPKMFRKD